MTQRRGEMTGRGTGRGSLVEVAHSGAVVVDAESECERRRVVGLEGLQAGAEVDSSSAAPYL